MGACEEFGLNVDGLENVGRITLVGRAGQKAAASLLRAAAELRRLGYRDLVVDLRGAALVNDRVMATVQSLRPAGRAPEPTGEPFADVTFLAPAGLAESPACGETAA